MLAVQRPFDVLYSCALFLVGYITFVPHNCHALTRTAPPVCRYSYSQQSTIINGQNITIEHYTPNGRGPFPLVFMLHGSAGAFSLKSSEEPSVDNFGEKLLARNCFAVVLPHYIEAFGYKSMTSKQDMISLFPQLLAITDSLLTDAETLPRVKEQSVFIFGESLGAYLGMVLALRRKEVAAVSEISGGMAIGYFPDNPHPLNILISHGVDDSLVPVREAEDLKRYCIEHHLRVEIDLYQGAGHFSPLMETKCIVRTIKFFLKNK